MFTKKPEKNGSFVDAGSLGTAAPNLAASPQVAKARPEPSTGRGGNDLASVIGADLTLTGNLQSKGEVQVEGEVRGDIHAQRVVIGEGALIAEEVVVCGGVQGSIRGNSVTFQSSCRVEADVFHKSLVIEQGAFFEGKSRRSEDPMSVPRTTNAVPPPVA
jgi:cytoskeletal protein CcmA (bactofilin family)